MREENKLAAYEALWVRLNAVNGLIEDLEAERADIKAKQRQLANSLVSHRVAELQKEAEARNAL